MLNHRQVTRHGQGCNTCQVDGPNLHTMKVISATSMKAGHSAFIHTEVHAERSKVLDLTTLMLMRANSCH